MILAFSERFPIIQKNISDVSWEGFLRLKSLRNWSFGKSTASIFATKLTDDVESNDLLNEEEKNLRGMLMEVGIIPVSINSFGSRTSIKSFSLWLGRSLTSS